MQNTVAMPNQNTAPSHAQSGFAVSFFDIVLLIGVGSIIAAFIYVGKKLQMLDDLKITIDKMNVDVKVVKDFLINENSFHQ